MSYRFTLDGQGDLPALVTAHAPRERDWNGFAVPMATGAEVRAFVAALVAADRSGVWTGLVLEDETGIIVQRADDDDDRWTRDPSGLYALDGFVWLEESGR